jgi:hypothetical protein
MVVWCEYCDGVVVVKIHPLAPAALTLAHGEITHDSYLAREAEALV